MNIIIILTEIRKHYETVCFIRDGAYGQINIGPTLHEWCLKHQKKVLLLKTSGGCSMTEAINDLGFMHKILHSYYSGKLFKGREYDDPPGPLYAFVKEYLLKYLSPGSFETYWKFLCTLEPIVDKAFGQMTVLSALKIGGYDGRTINSKTIMGHNKEFAELDQDRSDYILDLVDSVFCSYWYYHGLIHENVFEEVFGGEWDIDTINNRTGKPLNELATNRQRFMMDNHEAWLNELARRKEDEKIAAEEKERKRIEREEKELAKPVKFRECSMINCGNIIDETTTKSKKDNQKTWRNCKGKGCRIWGCVDHFEMVVIHQSTCKKVENPEE